jgi:hypothetical protein
VSRRTEAKKARRKKRLAARGPRWLPADGVDADVGLIDRELTERGWEFDEEYSTDEFATWYFPPSVLDTDDHAVEPVTRIWLTEADEWHVILVGSDERGVDYVFAADDLLDHLEAVEAYRHGDPAPAFG